MKKLTPKYVIGGVFVWMVASYWALHSPSEKPFGDPPHDSLTFAQFAVQALRGEGGLTLGERAALVAFAERAAKAGWLSGALEEMNDHVVGAYTAISELMRRWRDCDLRERGAVARVKSVIRTMYFQPPFPVAPGPATREDFLQAVFTAPRLTPYAARTMVRALNVAEMWNSEDPGRWPTGTFAPYLRPDGLIALPGTLRPLALHALKRSPPLKNPKEESLRMSLIAALEKK